MKANLKLPIGFVLISSAIALTFAFINFSALSVILIIGVVYLFIYLGLSITKHKDALVIEGDTMKVKLPFKNREYIISNIKSLYLDSEGKQVKGSYFDNEEIKAVKFFSDTFDKSILEIVEYIVSNYPHLGEKQSDE